MPRLVRMVCVVAVVALSTSCAKPKAKVIPDIPMEIPLPPPRVVETVDVPSAPPVVSATAAAATGPNPRH